MSNRFRKRRRFAPKTMEAKMKALSRKVTMVARQSKPELKTDYIAAHTITPNDSGEIEQLSLVAQGASQSQRTGLDIMAQEIHLRGSWISIIASVHCRVIMFVDTRQEIDSKSTVAEVLEEVNTFSAMNTVRGKRYRVLFDSFFHLFAPSLSVGPQIKIFNVKKKLNFRISFNGTLATDVEKNNIWLLTISDQATNTGNFRFSVLFSYTDA